MGGRAIKDPHKAWRLLAAKALSDSEKHWVRMRDGEQRPGEEPSIRWCACCALWVDGGCTECPISLRVGALGCAGTPYSRAADYIDSPDRLGGEADIQAEIDFLCETRKLVKLRKINPND